MNKLTNERLNFIERLNEEFLSNTGYGAYAHLSTCGVVNLFEQFVQQSTPVNMFIKSFVRKFHNQYLP